MNIYGFHHITLNCRDATENVAFYRDVLGLALIKQTVNFDDPFTYHLYYGDEKATPGTFLTFFPFVGIPKAKHGSEEIRVLKFSVASLDTAKKMLEQKGVSYATHTEFGLDCIRFTDPDGVELSFVQVESTLPKMSFFQGLYAVEIHTHDTQTLFETLTLLGYTKQNETQLVTRFKAKDQESFVDVVQSNQEPYSFGYGSVHHLAFGVMDDEQRAVLQTLSQKGYMPSPIINREYFKSIYFRVGYSVLFEIATHGPGMFIDETKLGSTLQIPKQHEKIATHIRERLQPL